MEVEQKLGKEHSEALEDGNVLLFSRNGIYQARIYKGDRKYLYRTLKTRDVNEARRLARKLYFEIQIKREQNLPLTQKSFAAVIDEYIALRQREYDRHKEAKTSTSTKKTTTIYMLRQIKRVSKFWKEYCGKMAVDKIDNAVLQDYVSWRKDYYGKFAKDKLPKNVSLNPADKTLEWETILAKTLLKFAHERGYRGANALPTWRFKVSKKIVRPAFTMPEYTKLYKRMRVWIREATTEEWRYTRELLRDYVLILANSGMRVGEANNLLETDVVEFTDDVGRRNYMFNVKGKTGKRVVIARTGVVRYVERTLKRNAEWKERWAKRTKELQRNEKSLRLEGYEGATDKADWLFRMADGGRVITLIDQFKAVLKSCDLEQNRYGEQYTLYSLRHFYAVNMLRRGKVSIFDLARNMGTSVQIIEQYYGKDATPLILATKLGG
jgi:site-specific recombinase XerD